MKYRVFLVPEQGSFTYRMRASAAISRGIRRCQAHERRKHLHPGVAQCVLFYLPADTPFPFRHVSPSTGAFPVTVCPSHYLFVAGSITDTWRSDSVMVRRVIASRNQTVSYCFVGRVCNAVTAVLIPFPQKHSDSEHHSNTAGTVTFWSSYLIATQCSRVSVEKLLVPQLVKKLPAFYCTRQFLTPSTTSRHLSLCSGTKSSRHS